MIGKIKLVRVYRGVPSELTTTVYLRNKSEFIEYQGLWDTGSQQSCIDPKIAKEFGYNVVGAGGVMSIHGISPANIYMVPIYIFGKDNEPLEIKMLGVDPISPTAKILLGMEVIASGRFEILRRAQMRMLTYELPYKDVVEYRDPH